MTGVVPSELPQTAPVAERCAYAAVCQMADSPTTAHQDCAAVVLVLRKPLAVQLRHGHRHAGLGRATLAYPGRELIESVVKVKAHTTLAQVEHDPALLLHHLGNGAADEYAKSALRRHPQPVRKATLAVEHDLEAVEQTLRLAAALLPLWERVPKAEILAAGREARPPTPGRVASANGELPDRRDSTDSVRVSQAVALGAARWAALRARVRERERRS